MTRDWYGYAPFFVSEAVFGVAIASTFFCVVSDRHFQSIFIKHWRLLCIAVLMVIVWRASPEHFYGLEYEDAYIYNVAGRQANHLEERRDEASLEFLVHVCAVGSIDSCYLSETSSGHYIGLPSLVSLAKNLENSSSTTYYINLIACCISVVFIFLICHLLTNEVAAPIAGCMIFSTTPAFAVYGVAAFSEPLSNALMGGVIYLYLRLFNNENGGRSKLISLISLGAMLMASVLVKRENIILSAGVVLISGIACISGPPQRRKNFIPEIIVGAVIVLLSSTILNLPRTLISETSEFSGFPFSVTNIKILFPAFVAALLWPFWYSVSALFVVWGAVHGIRSKQAGGPLAALATIYIVVYAAHVRSSAQIHGAFVGPDQALRYLTNLMCIWSVLGALGITMAIRAFKRPRGAHSKIAFVAVCIYAVACFVYTVDLRKQLRQNEYELRIGPALEASRFATKMGIERTYIVTREPLVAQMFAANSVNVISLNRLDKRLLGQLLEENAGLQLLYLEQVAYDVSADRERFAPELECLNSMPGNTLHKGQTFSVIQFSPRWDQLNDCR